MWYIHVLTPVLSHTAAGASWWMASPIASCLVTLRRSLTGSDASRFHWACWSESPQDLPVSALKCRGYKHMQTSLAFCVMPGIQTQVLQLAPCLYSVIIPVSCRVGATTGIHLWCQQGTFILGFNITPSSLKIFSAPLPTIAVLFCFFLTT